MTLRERLGLPTPPRPTEVERVPERRPAITPPEWVRRQQEERERLHGARVAVKDLTGAGG